MNALLKRCFGENPLGLFGKGGCAAATYLCSCFAIALASIFASSVLIDSIKSISAVSIF